MGNRKHGVTLQQVIATSNDGIKHNNFKLNANNEYLISTWL